MNRQSLFNRAAVFSTNEEHLPSSTNLRRPLSHSWHHCDKKENLRSMEFGGNPTTASKSRIHPSRTHSHASALRFFRGTSKTIFQEESFCQPPNRRIERRILKTSSSSSSCSPSSQRFGCIEGCLLQAGQVSATRQSERQFHRKRLHHLKRAIHKELLHAAAERLQKKQLQAITRIQAVVRAYYCRAHMIRFHPRRPPDSFRRHHHRRSGTAVSEITMSDFGDSSASFGSLSLSPSGFYEFGLQEDEHEDEEDDNEHLWESLSIEREKQEEKHQQQLQPHQDSLASLFSEVSNGDVAVKLPARKHSPKKNDDVVPPTRVSPTPLRTSLPSPTTGIDLPTMDGDRMIQPLPTSTSNSRFVLQPRPRQYRRCAKTVASKEHGHSSLSSFFVRDVAIQIPQRSRSPIPDGVASVPLVPTKEPSPPRARGYTR